MNISVVNSGSAPLKLDVMQAGSASVKAWTGSDWRSTRRHASATGIESRISCDDARVQAWVVPVDEAALMAEASAECLRQPRSAESSAGK